MSEEPQTVYSKLTRRWRRSSWYAAKSNLIAWIWKGRKLWGYRAEAFTIVLLALTMSYAAVLYWGLALPGEQAIYETLRLFVVESDVALGESTGRWTYGFLWLVRISAPSLVAFGFLDLFVSALLKRPVFFGSDHIVVGGLGRLGRGICEQLIKDHEIVAIEKDPDNPNIEWLRSQGMRVFVGDMTEEHTLKHARVHTAAGFVAVAHDDIANVNALDTALKLRKERDPDFPERGRIGPQDAQGGHDKVWGLAHVYDPEFKRNLCRHFEQDRDTGAADFFNSHQRAAARLVDEKLATAWDSMSSEHFDDALFVIAGFGRFGWAVFQKLLQRYHDQYPDWCYWLVDPELKDRSIRYSKVLMDEVLPENASLQEQRQFREQLQEKWVPMARDMLDFDLWLEIQEARKTRPVYFLICTDNDVKNLDFAMRLAERSQESEERNADVFSDDLILVTRLLKMPSFIKGDGLDEHIVPFELTELLQEVFDREVEETVPGTAETFSFEERSAEEKAKTEAA